MEPARQYTLLELTAATISKRSSTFFCPFFCLPLLLFSTMGYAAEAAFNLTGIWFPVAGLSQPWQADELPFTPQGREKFMAFQQQKHDSASFCLPYGTPRNTLNTVLHPIEILHTDKQLTMVFENRGDVRRIFLDGRPLPEDPIHSWLGYSVGTWEDSALSVQTIAMTDESILSDKGLPHSNGMQLDERFSLVRNEDETLLRIDLTLIDDLSYSEPLKTTRYFRQSAEMEMSEGSGLCLLDQWRQSLETLNRAMFRELQSHTQEEEKQ